MTDAADTPVQQPVLHVILPHRETLRILLGAEGAAWGLPSITPSKTEDVFDLFHSGMNAARVLGCATETLYSPYFAWENDQHGFRFVFVVANLDATFQAPDGARWVAPDELRTLTLADDYLRPVIEQYFEERVTGIYPVERPPWAFPGWTQRANAWITAQVEAQGWTLTSEIERVRQWCITCVLKAPTSAGDLYFKAVPPTFAREVGVTRFLAEQCPDHIPAVVAANETERWLLLRDFGKTYLGESKNVADWEQALHDFAALQVTMREQVDVLLQRGTLDYRLEVLPEKLDVLLADETMLKPDHHITAAEIERMRHFMPRIRALLEELAGYHLPATLVHGDFHVWNTAVQDGRIVFFDWTDAAVGHPFYDVGMYFEALRQSEVFADQPETVARLGEVYLQGLTALAPIETLRKALPLGEMAGMVHQAVNYRHLLRSIEPAERWSLQSVGFQVKQLLTWLETEEKS